MRNRSTIRAAATVAKPAFLVALFILCAAPLACPAPALAQAILLSVNGDPITNLDVEQRIKLLRVLRKPATNEAAVESLIGDRLKMSEAAKYGVKIIDSDLGQEVARIAESLKMSPAALFGALQQAGVREDHYKAFFTASLGFNVLMMALNKGVEASEEQVRAELAKEGGKTAAGTQYTVRQVIFTVSNTGGIAALTARSHEAEQLRGRFADCDSGVQLARTLPDVAVKEPLTRTSTQLGEPLKQMLDKTPVGHLTPPQRGPNGIEMLALCDRGVSKDDTAVRATISQKILSARLETEGERRLKDLRARAVIVKR